MGVLSTILLVLYLCVHLGVSCQMAREEKMPRWFLLVPPWFDLYLLSSLSRRLRVLGWLKTSLLLASVFSLTLDSVERQRVPIALARVASSFGPSLPLPVNSHFILQRIDVHDPELILTVMATSVTADAVILVQQAKHLCSDEGLRQLVMLGAIVKLRILDGEKLPQDMVCR